MKATHTPVCGYSEDTEILTRGGWVRFGQLTYMDEVATRSPEGRFEWQHPERIDVRPYEGEMVEFRNRTINFMVLPTHRLLIRRPEAYLRKHPYAEGREWHFRPASHFAANPSAQWEIPGTSTWAGAAPAEFIIPGWEADRPHPAHEAAAEWLTAFLTADWTPSAEVIAGAKAAGIGAHALDEGRKLIGAPKRRCGSTRHGKGVSWWETGQPTKPLVKGSGHYQPMRELRMPMAAFCRFLGLYLAEGWTAKHNDHVIISQMPTSRHLPEIREILGATGLTWNYNPRTGKFTTSHKTLKPWLAANAGYRAWGKYVPSGFKDFPVGHLEGLLRGGMIGDGHWGACGQRRYTTTSWQLANDVQEIFQKLGIDSWIRATEPEEMAKYNYGTFGTNKHRIYVVHERMFGSHWLPRAAACDYRGNVGCVTISNGMVYVRRGHRPTWSGANT